MKVALVHDYLNQLGGGERVLDILMQMFPEAPIYTLLYDEKKTRGRYRGRVKRTSFLDFSFARNHHRLFIPLMPLAARRMNLGGEYDLIISDSAGFGKGIGYDRMKTKHLCYVHTPLRYAWETETYFNHSLKAQVFNTLLKPAFDYVRNFDYWAGQRPDLLLANSRYIAEKIKEYYGRDATVLYPPVDTSKFFLKSPAVADSTVIASTRSNLYHDNPNQYYLAAGRFLHYKRFDLIIEAFNKLNLPLVVVGTGPEARALRARATSPNIRFAGFVKDDAELRKLYASAKAFIMANEEDFGLVMAEAQACGTPVIAFSKGGASEIVEPRVSGMLFHDQTPEALIEIIEQSENIRFDRKVISDRAQRFSVENFQKGILEAIQKLSTH